MSTRKPVIRTALAALGFGALGLAVAVSLAGCLPTGGDTPSSSPSAPGPSVSPTPSASPSETAAPEDNPTPVSIPCASIISAQAMYDFNPNFGLLDSFSPDTGTLAARAVADKGTACRWVNQTSGDTIDVTISQPGPLAFAAAKSAANSGAPVSGLGDAAYFSVSGGSGELQAFRGPFWITATSVYFSTGADASDIMKDAVAAAH